MRIPRAFKHQKETTQFILNNKECLITSDPGTGKTRSVLDAFAKRKKQSKGRYRMLVLAPLSILQASWGDDINKFQPDLTYSIAYAKNRMKAFRADVDIVITNHDAVKWIMEDENSSIGTMFDELVIDEFTAFKNRTSQRSKKLAAFAFHMDYRIAMSGTPNSNSILDIWHPAFIVDRGQRLGRRFYDFRQQVCIPQSNGFGTVWVDKADAEILVANQLGDITIRYELEECLDMPETSTNYLYVDLPPKIQKQYETLLEDAVLYTGKTTIEAVNKGVLVRKLLQLCTGAVYSETGKAEGIHKERYELVIDLVQQRKHSLVAFNWKHERDHLMALANKYKIKYAVLDGDTPADKRTDIVARLQGGQLTTVFCHPQSAGHGLTMTKANTIIWASPTYNAEHFQQFNRRIYRAGQKQKTEVIMIAARNTWETDVYQKLEGKLARMDELLTVLKSIRRAA